MLKDCINVGIIGCGKIAQVRHIPEYFANESATIVGYYDFIEERAQDMARQYGGRSFSSAQELLECPEIDAVSICTANNAHAEMTVAALRAGKHVLCEKPMAMSMEECESMVKEAERVGKKLMIGHNQRFMTEHIRAKQMLDDGVIGRVLTFKTCFGHSGPDYWSVDPGTANWFFDKSKSVFGALADLGIHKTDLIQYLLDSEVDEIKSMISTLDKTYSDGTPVNVEDNAICLYKMKNGVIGSMTASWTYYGEEDNSTVIYGTEGIMKIHGESHCIEIFRKNGEKVTYETTLQNNSGVIDHFINCLVNNVESQISAEKILSSMSVMLRSIAASGKPV